MAPKTSIDGTLITTELALPLAAEISPKESAAADTLANPDNKSRYFWTVDEAGVTDLHTFELHANNVAGLTTAPMVGVSLAR